MAIEVDPKLLELVQGLTEDGGTSLEQDADYQRYLRNGFNLQLQDILRSRPSRYPRTLVAVSELVTHDDAPLRMQFAFGPLDPRDSFRRLKPYGLVKIEFKRHLLIPDVLQHPDEFSVKSGAFATTQRTFADTEIIDEELQTRRLAIVVGNSDVNNYLQQLAGQFNLNLPQMAAALAEPSPR